MTDTQTYLKVGRTEDIEMQTKNVQYKKTGLPLQVSHITCKGFISSVIIQLKEVNRRYFLYLLLDLLFCHSVLLQCRLITLVFRSLESNLAA